MATSVRTLAGRAWRLLRHPISQNAVALYGVQFATFVVPLVTLPYLSRVLEPDGFGLVVFAQGFSFLLGLLVNYGFDAVAVRDAAARRGDPDALAALAARVQGGKLLLVTGSLVAAVLATVVIPKLHDHPEYALFAWLAAVGQGLSPGWFFIGIERLRLTSLIQLSSRIVSAILTFVFVSSPNDGVVVLALYAASTVGGALVVNTLMYRLVPLRLPRLRHSIEAIRGAWVLFVGTGAVTLYTSANVVLLGLFATNAQVAHFGAAERLVRAASQLLGPIAVAVYPRLAYLHAADEPERARRLAWLAISVLGGIGLVSALGLALLAPVIIPIVYGPGFGEAVNVLRILAFIVPCIALTSALAGGWMLALHMDRKLVKVIIRAGLANVVLSLLLAPALGPIGMSCCVVTAELLALGGCLVEIRRQERNTDGARLLLRPAPR